MIHLYRLLIGFTFLLGFCLGLIFVKIIIHYLGDWSLPVVGVIIASYVMGLMMDEIKWKGIWRNKNEN